MTKALGTSVISVKLVLDLDRGTRHAVKLLIFTVIYKDQVEPRSLDTRFRGYDEILLICVIPVKTGHAVKL